MASAATHPYQETFQEISRCVKKHRDDCVPSELAREILSYDHPGHSHVVGITDQARSVYLYHCEKRFVVAFELYPDGLADVGPKVAIFRTGSSMSLWLGKLGGYLIWKHPRYR